MERVYEPSEFLQLPLEMQQTIAMELDIQSLLNLCAASKGLKGTICDDDTFWRNKYIRDFSDSDELSPREKYYHSVKPIATVSFEIDSEDSNMFHSTLHTECHGCVSPESLNMFTLTNDNVSEMINFITSSEGGYKDWSFTKGWSLDEGTSYGDYGIESIFIDKRDKIVSFSYISGWENYKLDLWIRVLQLAKFMFDNPEQIAPDGRNFNIHSDYTVKKGKHDARGDQYELSPYIFS